MIIKYEKDKKDEIIKRAADILSRGGIVMYASDTSYGLAIDYANKKAIKRLNKLKNRQKPLYSLNFANLKQIEQFYQLSEKQKETLKRFLPGELTFIIEEDKPACRIPKISIIVDIAKRLDRPLTATSANISGQTPAYKIYNLPRNFLDKVELIIDQGKLAKIPPSTIVNISREKYKILGQGRLYFDLG